MSLVLSFDLSTLPPGWSFDGLWFDSYENNPATAWSADASFRQLDENAKNRVLLEVESKGATAQEALDGLPAAIVTEVNRLYDSIGKP